MPRESSILIRLGGFFLLALAAPFVHAESLSHGRFKSVPIYRPAGPVKQVALFLSGDAGWDRGMAGMSAVLSGQGTLVIGIDVPKLFASLEAEGDTCVFPDGDLENL